MLFRLILLLAVGAMLVLFLLQNLSPSLALTFLGLKTPAFPFSWWVLGAIAAGAATTLAISFLFSLSHFVARRFMRSQFKRAMRQTTEQPASPSPSSSTSRTNTARAAEAAAKTQRQDDATWRDWSGYETSQPRSSSTATTAATDPLDDWETPASEDWEDSRRDRGSPSRPTAPSTPRTDFEKPQEPRRGDLSGSTYSYSYRDGEPQPPKEPVVDADFRVIVPPYRSLEDGPAPVAEANADDWFEDGNDDFGADAGRDRPRR
jgi:hypothetical protein